MAKRTKRRAFKIDAEQPTPEQIRTGAYVRDFVTHAESNTKAMTHRNRESSILDKWMREGGPGFEQGAQRVIADCQRYWEQMGGPRTTSHYGERMPSGDSDDGTRWMVARDQLRFFQELLDADPYWSVYEAVVRHGEPAGVAGSSFATNKASSIQSAKVITGMVASFLAAKLGY